MWDGLWSCRDQIRDLSPTRVFKLLCKWKDWIVLVRIFFLEFHWIELKLEKVGVWFKIKINNCWWSRWFLVQNFEGLLSCNVITSIQYSCIFYWIGLIIIINSPCLSNSNSIVKCNNTRRITPTFLLHSIIGDFWRVGSLLILESC